MEVPSEEARRIPWTSKNVGSRLGKAGACFIPIRSFITTPPPPLHTSHPLAESRLFSLAPLEMLGWGGILRKKGKATNVRFSAPAAGAGVALRPQLYVVHIASAAQDVLARIGENGCPFFWWLCRETKSKTQVPQKRRYPVSWWWYTKEKRNNSLGVTSQPHGCGSKPMVAFWGRSTTHFSLF